MPTVVAEKTKMIALCAAFVGPLVEAFLAEHDDWSATRLGREALKDPGKIGMMRRGTQLRTGTARKVVETIDRAKPGFCAKFLKGMKINA